MFNQKPYTPSLIICKSCTGVGIRYIWDEYFNAEIEIICSVCGGLGAY